MKRGAPEHPKMSRLAEILKIEHAHAVGIMEMLWHYTARFAIQGDVGRWPDDSIAHAVRWRGEPGKLIDALVKAGWLDRDPDYRLIVHDWDQHADQSVSKTLKNRALDFVCATRDHRVYFVRSAATGLIKIGTTRRPVKNRVADIQISSGERIEILCDVPGSFTLEVKFQEQFAEHRVSGEWFRDTPEIRQFIEELRVQNDSRSFRKISGKGWNDSRKESLAGGKSKPQPVPEPVPEPEPEPIIPPPPPKGGEGEVVRALAFDEQWQEFHSAAVRRNVLPASAPEWANATHVWRTLDFEQRAAAIRDVAERAADSPVLKSLPANYLRDRKWERPEFAARPRAPNSPAMESRMRAAVRFAQLVEGGSGEGQ